MLLNKHTLEVLGGHGKSVQEYGLSGMFFTVHLLRWWEKVLEHLQVLDVEKPTLSAVPAEDAC